MTKTELLDQLTDQINCFQKEVDLVCDALEEMSDDYQHAFIEEGACYYWLTEDDFDEYLWSCVEDMIPRGNDKRANKVIEDFFIAYFDFEKFKRDCLLDDYYRAHNGVFLRAYY